MKKATCYIVAAGDWYGEKIVPKPEDYVIAVDGGYDTLKRMDLEPDLLIGDFDSIVLFPEAQNSIRLNPIKDETDLFYSVQYAVEQGYETIKIYGGTGGDRISHTVANIQMLFHFKEVQCFLYDRTEVMFLVHNGKICFSKEANGYISVFSVSQVSQGVEEKGLKYEISDGTLTSSIPLGVSNEFLGKESYISVKQGTLLIITDKTQLDYIVSQDSVL